MASTDVVTVSPEQDLYDALSLMAQHQVRRVPVVEEDGRLSAWSPRPTSPDRRMSTKPVSSSGTSKESS